MSQQTINPPQVQGLPLGATSERDAAIINQQRDASNLAALVNVTNGKVGGRRMKHFRGGFATPKNNDFVVPIVSTNYNDPMAGPQSAVNQQVGIAGTFNQGSENAKFDDMVAPPTPIPAGQLKGGRGRKHSVSYNRLMKKVLDRNHDGVVSKRELDYAIDILLKANKGKGKYPNTYDSRIMKDVLDTNYNGVVSKRELDNAIDILLKANRANKTSKYPSKYDRRIFKDVLDTNRDGVVSKREVDYAVGVLKSNRKLGKTKRRKTYTRSLRKKSRKLRK
jgi:EF hand